MRTIIQQSIFILLFFASLTLSAQPGGGGRAMNPEQRAEQQTTAMKEKLTLSDAQAGKVQEINLKYAKQMQAAREEANGDWSTMRETMQGMRAEQDKELQTVMTEAQWQQWVKYREEMRANRGNRGGFDQGNRANPGPQNPPADPKSDKKSKKKKKSKTDDSTEQ
ncbi:MAG: DUF4890 domain-containing protein [Bacteroidetes bacterium]|nr:MAG: DUF4890 domain-containing protein [Bacteroidota bacterium]